MDFFSKLFDFPITQNPETDPNHRRFGVADFWDRIFDNGREEPNDPFNRKSQFFTDPFAMHKLFHEQVNNFFKNFGMPSFGNFDLPAIPSVLDRSFMDEYPPDSRKSFLKSGVSKQSPPHGESENIDRDLDGKVSKMDIDRFFQKSDSEDKIIEHKFVKPFSGVFSQSIQVEAFTKPDGSMEIRKVITDSDGNQKVMITQRIGEKEYTFNY